MAASSTMEVASPYSHMRGWRQVTSEQQELHQGVVPYKNERRAGRGAARQSLLEGAVRRGHLGRGLERTNGKEQSWGTR